MSKIGIVGCGFIGGVHFSAYCKIKGAQLIAVCDQDLTRAKNLLQGASSVGNISVESVKPVSFNTSEVKIYTRYEEMLKDPEIDIIDVCLPTYLHKEAVVKAAKAGKHILCEKPIALSVKEADEMIKAAKKAKVKFMVAHVIRFWPEYAVLAELIKTKAMGKLLEANFQRHSPTPTWSWNNWILDEKKSMSAAGDLHIHDTDYILYICGTPKSVSSLGVKGRVTKKGVDHIMTQFNYGNGPKVYSEGGWAYGDKYPFRMAFWALFEKGAVEFNSMNCQLTVYEDGKEPVKPIPPAGDGYLREIQYFLNCIENGKNPSIVTPDDARESLRITLAEINSVEKAKPIVLK
ncbi:MAG: Gfo/Idh/MocA family oxidoreductase [Candidatus Firestonebacteria bacterium]|nr:Gfo/Idh/MocA family oxidoreductase [Candidatus Firestonebacteria bacterium]